MLSVFGQYFIMNRSKWIAQEAVKMIHNKYAMTTEENIFCAKRILVDSIYRQANLEGIAVTLAETQDILNNVNVASVTPNEISKVCCLRDGWK